MVRRCTMIAPVCLVILLATLLAACGGDIGLTSQLPESSPTVPGPQVTGTVRMPNGRVAALSPSLLDRFAALAESAASALTANVSPVGSGVTVTLGVQRDDGGVDGPQGSAKTNAQGGYALDLPNGSDPANVCRYVVSVGDENSGTLTRAFLTSAAGQDIDYATEAAVRLITNRVIDGAPLCNFSAREIRDLVAAIRALPDDVSGAGAEDVNFKAFDAATGDPAINQMLDADAVQPVPPTNTPRNTWTATATHTSTQLPTATRTRTGIPTLSAIPTRTLTPTITRTCARRWC